MQTYLINECFCLARYKTETEEEYYKLLRTPADTKGTDSLIEFARLTTMVKVGKGEFPKSGLTIYTEEGEALPIKTVPGMYYTLSTASKEEPNLFDEIKKEWGNLIEDIKTLFNIF